MAQPPIFDRNTHERQKTLLAAEEHRLQSKSEWKGIAMLAVVAGWIVVAVVGLFTIFR